MSISDSYSEELTSQTGDILNKAAMKKNAENVSPKKKATKKQTLPFNVTSAKTESDDIRINPPHFELTSNQMAQAVILSEILGKPVSKRYRNKRF